jgi:diaminopimelate epimerase
VLLDPAGRRPVSAAEARALCDRRRGVGADGVLRAGPGDDDAALSMDLRNADGTTAEMSGNGIRCLVQAAVDGGLVATGAVVVRTGAGLRTVDYRPGAAPGLGSGRVAMGAVVVGDRVAVPGWRWGRRVDVGNPHVVLFGAAPDDGALARLGAQVERSVDGGANVEFVWRGADVGAVDEIVLRVWERGVGETLACGTGACAAAAAAHAEGDVGPRVTVRSPGGRLEVELGDDGAVLSGPTQVVGEVHVAEAVLGGLVDALEAPATGRADPDEVAAAR